MSDDVAIAIAIFLRDHLRYVAVCVLWRRVFGSLVVASLSRRVAIVVGYFRPRTSLLGGRGGSERPPRVRPPDRPIVYLTDRHCTRASLLHGNQPSQRGGCCGRVRQSHQPPRIARTCARSWCVVPVIGPPAPWLAEIQVTHIKQTPFNDQIAKSHRTTPSKVALFALS